MFKRTLILLAIIGIFAIGCSKKAVKSNDAEGDNQAAQASHDISKQDSLNEATGDKEKAVEAAKDGKKKEVNEIKEAAAADEYVIGAEDVLEIMVWRNEMLSRPRIVVRPDGKISLPLVGDIHTAGLTAKQVKEDIEKRLKEYEELPNVTVIVAEINSYYIYILGEVTRPGRYQLKSNISVLQAVSLGGGFTNWASPNSMVVLRRNGEKEEKIKVRYKKIISGSRPEDNIVLKPGDTIIIP